jgi:probable phosphoglycerate mutase
MARRPADSQDGPGFFDEAGPGEQDSGHRPEDTGHGGQQASGSSASGHRRLLVEADGGSRGNPGPAAYGALVRDADTGETLLSEGLTIGRATNNVAEYRGLIAGLEMARQVDAAAPVEVRMDSKLVVEQMAGRWKIKHPDMIPLARQAARLRPASVTWTWVPREQNARADALANLALDGTPVPRADPAAAR